MGHGLCQCSHAAQLSCMAVIDPIHKPCTAFRLLLRSLNPKLSEPGRPSFGSSYRQAWDQVAASAQINYASCRRPVSLWAVHRPQAAAHSTVQQHGLRRLMYRFGWASIGAGSCNSSDPQVSAVVSVSCCAATVHLSGTGPISRVEAVGGLCQTACETASKCCNKALQALPAPLGRSSGQRVPDSMVCNPSARDCSQFALIWAATRLRGLSAPCYLAAHCSLLSSCKTAVTCCTNALQAPALQVVVQFCTRSMLLPVSRP